MNQKNVFRLSLLAAMGMGIASVNAASTGTINFNGKITDSTCNVNVDGQGVDATITLPTVPTTELVSPGQTTGRTAFNMALTDCQVGAVDGAKTVAAFFQTGATVDNNTGRLKQTSAGGATNVSLQLADGTSGSPIFVGSQNQITNSTFLSFENSPNVTLPYWVEYYAEGATTPGVVTSSVVYNLQYK